MEILKKERERMCCYDQTVFKNMNLLKQMTSKILVYMVGAFLDTLVECHWGQLVTWVCWSVGWSTLKYLNNYWVVCHEIWYLYLSSPEDEF